MRAFASLGRRAVAAAALRIHWNTTQLFVIRIDLVGIGIWTGQEKGEQRAEWQKKVVEMKMNII